VRGSIPTTSELSQWICENLICHSDSGPLDPWLAIPLCRLPEGLCVTIPYFSNFPYSGWKASPDILYGSFFCRDANPSYAEKRVKKTILLFHQRMDHVTPFHSVDMLALSPSLTCTNTRWQHCRHEYAILLSSGLRSVRTV